jgi:hypothetical protein
MQMFKAMIVACAMALAACAGTSEAPDKARPAPDTRAAAEKLHCVRYTGTYIPVPEGQCVAAAGRVFTADQIRNTGASTVPDALRKLGVF